MFCLTKFLKILSLGLLCGVSFPTYALNSLPVDQVFQVTIQRLNHSTLAVRWHIKPGYYLYRNKIQFHSVQVPLKTVVLPKGIVKQGRFLGKYQVYQGHVTALLRFLHPFPSRYLDIVIHYQGCASAGFCYPPVTKHMALNFMRASCIESHLKPISDAHKPSISENTETQQGKAVRLLDSHNLAWILVVFFCFGLLLSLTPCVLPLIPVLSAIILGQKQLTTARAFSLSLIYVLAMAATYALAGVFAGLLGSYLQALLQSPWIILLVSMVFVLLAFSLFGFYELRLPTSWQEKLTRMTNRQRGGRYVGVAFMGCLSTLVISPCITAPLVGVLTYIGNTGNAVLGGFALFILGLGSGVPLLIIGTSAGKWLPKSGPWMNWVKIILGIMMLVMAGWLLLRLVPIDSRAFHFIPFHQAEERGESYFQPIKGISGLRQALVKAKRENRPVLLDFYANWCLSCKEMEHAVLSSEPVRLLLTHFILLRADVTANDALDRALETELRVIAPPTFLFFSPDGNERVDTRIVGQVSQQAFLEHLKNVLNLGTE